MKLTIHTGKHFCNRILPKFTFKDILRGTFKLEGDFSYSIPLQKDTNKLVGLSDAWHHHIDSVRIGWRWDPKMERVQLMAIIYSNADRTITPMEYIDTNKEYTFNIMILSDPYVKQRLYVIYINQTRYEYYGDSSYDFIRYILFPYFGGKQEAPRDFKIILNLN